MNLKTVILADGNFPTHAIPLGYLKNADRIICCDGSVKDLIEAGFIPEAIVGDMDSLDDDLAKRFADRIFRDGNQDTNDLTKAVAWCTGRGLSDIVILGATGKREDHTIGNISLLVEYVKSARIMLVTDSGIFIPLLEGCELSSLPGQQVSIFSIDPDLKISSSGLRYQLRNTMLTNWWTATLNEVVGSRFKLDFNNGRVIVFLKFTGE